MTLENKNHIATLSDEDLLAQHKKSGHAEYFGTLYNRYIPLLYGLCLKYLNDEAKAQDAVMQLFENLLPKISGYDIQTFRTWLYSVARNHCLQILRKESKEILVDFNSDLMESDEVLHLLCEEDGNAERMQALRNCLGRLPDGQRISITHFFMQEMSYADIAEKTGYSLNTVKSNIQNGKRNLKICINKHSK
ncbi:RNA polymerase sigma factor [Bacteroides sp. 51]|uniref:RNA polymerase sigma factor n=1 Tax=Bacteroides sp. 51 TaxID=2302938 RepID=UPI0013D61B92|nr:sigma-70 family RNA polymerase sigma factor [Bacteroides sp. 51]NDV82791.1 sigma-70 family RNA polymerase sigma factor [Bacteroides sp. 51]